jgi:hypothetical protein
VKFVCATPSNLKGWLLEFPRLYAFPAQSEAPAPESFVILDSGAFGLSQRGIQMSKAHMAKLAEHYALHGASDAFPHVAVAPDAYPNPFQTMRQWHYWYDQSYTRVAPVIQQTQKHGCDARVTLMQCLEYEPYKPQTVFVSNPGLTGKEARFLGFQAVLDTVQETLAPRWVHVLGAGWHPEDLEQWTRLRGWDSMDTIAYYTDAKNGLCWDGLAFTNFKDVAVRNGRAAQQIFEKNKAAL